MKRGILYILWGNQIDAVLGRSIESVKAVYPEMPIEVARADDTPGLAAKCRMGGRTPFESTLYLDADTVVLGNLDFAFEKAERFGLACSICEAPWMRRYGVAEEREMIEYNTGVLFFTKAAKPVFDRWEQLAATPARSRWRMQEDPPGYVRGLAFDDQASFARAIEACEMNPYVLPINYNLRPYFHRSLFAPAKIWHSYEKVPDVVIETSRAVERGELPVTYIRL